MSSWLGRLFGGRQPAEPPAPVEATAPSEPLPADPSPATVDVMPVQILGPDGPRSVEIRTGGERITDVLNRLGEAESDGMLLVLPPEQAHDPRRHLHRPGQSLRVRIEPYEVVGLVHVPPGSQPMGYLGRVNPRFVPLTDAVIRLTDGSPDELRSSVVIVNLPRAQEVREIAAADREPRVRAQEPPS